MHAVSMKERLERRKHCALAVVRRSQKISPRRRPLRGGAGLPKFNQLESVATFTYRPSLVKIDARNFELSWKQSHEQTHKQTGPITIRRAAMLSAQCKYVRKSSGSSCVSCSTLQRCLLDSVATMSQEPRPRFQSFSPRTSNLRASVVHVLAESWTHHCLYLCVNPNYLRQGGYVFIGVS